MANVSDVPYLQVVRGDATPEEVAALVTVLTAAQARAAEAQRGDAARTGRTSAWSARSRLVRRPVEHGPGAWRASAFPQG